MTVDILQGFAEGDRLTETARSQYKKVRDVYQEVLFNGSSRQVIVSLDLRKFKPRRLPVWQNQVSLQIDNHLFTVTLDSTPSPTISDATINMFVESEFGQYHRETFLPVSSIRTNSYGDVRILEANKVSAKLDKIKTLTTSLESWLANRKKGTATGITN